MEWWTIIWFVASRARLGVVWWGASTQMNHNHDSWECPCQLGWATSSNDSRMPQAYICNPGRLGNLITHSGITYRSAKCINRTCSGYAYMYICIGIHICSKLIYVSVWSKCSSNCNIDNASSVSPSRYTDYPIWPSFVVVNPFEKCRLIASATRLASNHRETGQLHILFPSQKYRGCKLCGLEGIDQLNISTLCFKFVWWIRSTYVHHMYKIRQIRVPFRVMWS